MSKANKSLSLVLGSGGARGLAHIGVICWLEEHNFQIKSISGCSMGALIGGVYAANKLDEFEHWVRAINRIDMMTLLDFSWQSNGLVKGDKIINTLTSLVGDILIEDLPLKYTAIAADILNEKEIWMNSGKLFDAIRASISLPLFFTPFHYQGVELIDGGVLNPVPIAPTFGDQTDFTLAVNLGGALESPPVIEKLTEKPIEKQNTFFSDNINRFINSFCLNEKPATKNNFGAYDVANQAFDAMQSTISRQKLAAYPPDFSIEIARNACGTLEFDKADAMIELGYEKAKQQLSHLL